MLVAPIPPTVTAPDPTAAPAPADLRALLADEQPRARRWWWTWVGTFGALTAGQGVLALTTTDPDARASALVGGASSLLGVVNLLASPYPSLHAHADLARLGDDDAELVALFERTAAAERFQTGPLAHAGGLVASVTPAAIAWLVLDRPADAALDLVGGVALSEAQILTSPRRVKRAWRDRGAATTWWVVPSPRGLTVAGRF